MNYKFFSIFLFFFLYCGVSQSTETFSSGTVGTSTIATSTISPYIIDVIFEDNITIFAGDIVQLQLKKVVWSDKVDREVDINWAGEYINQQGQFSTTKAGNYVVNIDINGIRKTIYIQVLPLHLAKIKINVKENLIYGRTYDKRYLFEFKGFDKYQNEVLLPEDIKYSISKDSLGYIATWIGASTGNKEIDEILKSGNILSGDEILFFERGTFTITVTVGSITSKLPIFVDFDNRYKNIEDWKDYALKNIDFDKKLVEVEFNINDIKVPHQFNLPTNWIEKFNQPNFLSKLQVVCWVHYKILEIREQVIQTQVNKMFNELILKPMFQRIQK